MLPVEQPFKTYTDRGGKPLNSGFVYFGQPNLDPISNPITVYWDAAGTIPAAQPLRTMGGYIVRNGTPANVFISGAYSELVNDSRGNRIFYAENSEDFSVSTFINKLISPIGSSLIGFINAGIGAVARTIQDRLRETVSVFDYMTDAEKADALSGNPTLDHTGAFNKAFARRRSVFAPAATYRCNLVIGNSCRLIGAGRLESIFRAANSALPIIHLNETDSNKYYFMGAQDLTVDGQGSATIGIKVGVDASAGTGTVTYGSIERVSVRGCTDNIYVKDTVGFELNHVYSYSAANACIKINTNDIVTVVSMRNCQFRLGKYGVFLRGGALLNLSTCVIESNSDIGLFYIRDSDSGARQTTLDTCWFEGNGYGLVSSSSGSVYIDVADSVNPEYTDALQFVNCTLSSVAGAKTVYLNRGDEVLFDRCLFDDLTATKLYYEPGTGYAFATLRQCSTINNRASPTVYASFPALTSYNSGERLMGFKYEYYYKGHRYSNDLPTAFSTYVVTAPIGIACTGAGAEFNTIQLAAASSTFEAYDTANCFLNGAFTAPEAGMYGFKVVWPMTAFNVNMTRADVGFIVNPSGTPARYLVTRKRLSSYSSSDVETFAAEKTLKLNAGDVVVGFIVISGAASNTAEVYRNETQPGIFQFSGSQIN